MWLDVLKKLGECVWTEKSSDPKVRNDPRVFQFNGEDNITAKNCEVLKKEIWVWNGKAIPEHPVKQPDIISERVMSPNEAKLRNMAQKVWLKEVTIDGDETSECLSLNFTVDDAALYRIVVKNDQTLMIDSVYKVLDPHNEKIEKQASKFFNNKPLTKERLKYIYDDLLAIEE